MSEQNNGCVLLNTGWVLCSDGEMRENSSTGYGTIVRPKNEFERATLVVKFWTMKLELAVAEFDEKKTMLLVDTRQRLKTEGNVGGPCMDAAEAVAVLTALKAKVNHCQEMLSEAGSQLEAHTPASVKQGVNISEENRQRLGDFVNAVEQIEI